MANGRTYIHELPGWPSFRWDHQKLSARLASVRHRQGLILGQMSALGFEPLQNAVLGVLIEDVVQSSAIEGESLDEQQVRSSISRRLGLDTAGLPRPARDVDGVVEMMLDASQGFTEPLTAERLYRWHSNLFPTGRSSMGRIVTGEWRHGPMEVISGPIGSERVHFEAPAHTRLDLEMGAFLSWFESPSDSDDGVLRAAIAHLWFVTIHPFDDGNGRIGRAIMDMALARSERSSQRFYSMSAQIFRVRTEYYEILERTQRGDLDITDWLLWFLTQLDRALDSSEQAVRTVQSKREFWLMHAGKPLNERQRRLLERLLDGFEGKLTTSKWAKIAKCSQDTAHRDILDLIEKGMMRQDESGGRSTSYSLTASG